ncbi:MAG: GGDEF domain-containing phosphodiesterase [Betaproteobacteria bacterium]|nr:GGDEF domain-containing phosphodiesterase [Betaproteobacteria bacterium]MDH5219954.1 GGDEF domain-containing phosphodiesterase [Betaproteobacteria bacterium]MDH5350778.1 GGDEF domain-containing phosphodiesterase [Betaproteobacteria bacterium]
MTAPDGAALGLLLEQFGLDAQAVAALDALGTALSTHAPEALRAARGESTLSGATSPFFLPLLPAAMSEPQRALVNALSVGALGRDSLSRVLAEWAATLNPEEPAARAQRDCRPLQDLLRAGALRLYADDAARCEAALAAAEGLNAVQLMLIARSAARGADTRAGSAPGMTEFTALLDALAQTGRAAGEQLAALFVDCGVVGRIDAVWGYDVGDGVRERLRARLRSEVLREQDLIGDPGRDEFACVLRNVRGEGVALLAAEKMLRALDQPLWVDADELYARPAVGIALYPEHAAGAADLLRRAKTACRAARERPGRLALFASDQVGMDAELLVYENRLRAAVAQDALDIVFQPQWDMRTGLIVGAESQLRWRDASLGAVPVDKAIAAAESAGLVNELTLWMVNGALRTCRQFRDTAGLDLRVGVTLSAKSLRQPELPDFVASALKTWNLRPSRLALEITETAALAHSLQSVETLQRLRKAGVRLALDDPRAGYASLAWLAALPFHEWRIDLAGVGDIVESPPRLALVRSLADCAHHLKLDVLVAGVDDAATAAALKPLGCDVMQGAHLGAPADATAFVKAYRTD